MNKWNGRVLTGIPETLNEDGARMLAGKVLHYAFREREKCEDFFDSELYHLYSAIAYKKSDYFDMEDYKNGKAKVRPHFCV